MLIYMDLLVFYMHYELLSEINIAVGSGALPSVISGVTYMELC